jgi:hypothetical protein
MPVTPTTLAEFDRWPEADTLDALKLQQPLPDAQNRSEGREGGRRPSLASVLLVKRPAARIERA